MGPLLVGILKQWLTGSETIAMKVITKDSFWMSLKLVITCVKNTSDLQFYKDHLPRDLLVNFEGEQKLKEILVYLADLIHAESKDDVVMTLAPKQEKAALSKDQQKSKKAAMIAKMKAK